MSQVAKIISATVIGAPYLGEVDTDTGVREDRYTTCPNEVAHWLWHGHRGRFNDRRALRQKYVYAPNPGFNPAQKPSPTNPKNLRVLDDDGAPILTHVGGAPGMDRKKSEFKREHSYAAAIPDLMLQHADRTENTEWFAAAKRRATLNGKGRKGGAMPWFRAKTREPVRFGIFTGGPKATSPQAKLHRTGKKTAIVTISGMNPAGKTTAQHGRRWAIKFRIRYSQPIAAYTSVMVNWSAKQIAFTSPVPARAHTFTGATVGLDVGVVRTIATSDSNFFDQPKTDELDRKIKKHQKSLARKRRINNPTGQKGWAPTRAYANKRNLLSAAHQARNNRLGDWRHKITRHLVDTYDVIAYESLNVKGMTRSAKGTVAEPGKNVRQKAGLNRSLASSAFGTLRTMLEYKAEAAGVLAIPVPPRNTSLECSKCHAEPRKENRKSQAVFSCLDCGYTTNADLNAAENIRQRGIARLPVGVNTGGPGHGPWELWTVRPFPLRRCNPSGKPARPAHKPA